MADKSFGLSWVRWTRIKNEGSNIAKKNGKDIKV